MQISVIILRGQTRQSDRHIGRLQEFFTGREFRVTVMNGNIMDGLHHSHKQWPELPCLIIRDGSVPLPGLTADLLLQHLQEVIALSAHVIHLCRWNDLCYKNISAAPNWYYTHQSLEVQATIFSVNIIRDILINRESDDWAVKLAMGRKEYSPILVPKYNLFNFDNSLSVTDVDFQRINPCQPGPDESTTSGVLGLVLVISAIIGVVLILLLSYFNNKEEDSILPAVLLGILLVFVFIGTIVTLVLIAGSNE